MNRRRLGLATMAITLLGAGTAWAAFEPEGSPYPTGADPYAVYTADFNADGRPDLAVENGTSSDVNVYLRQSGGFVQEAGSPISVG
ncbi:MAG TPA: VCBS repeat-containing protein, partial [Solirubrobacter sp.]|nr:VCBS repeat-containing protein [Solirubrobacter sp.]